MIKLQQQTYQQRERDRLEVKRRQEKEHANAKAVACQLACRVLFRGHRTRALAAALWRWRSQAAELKMEQNRRDEQRHVHEQVMHDSVRDAMILQQNQTATGSFSATRRVLRW